MVVINIEKERKYLREELVKLGLEPSNNKYSNYIVFKCDRLFYLFKEADDNKLLLNHIGY